MPGSEARVIEAQLDARNAFRKLSFFQTFFVRSGRKIYIGHEKREGWKGELPFYLFFVRCLQALHKRLPPRIY